MAEWMGSGLIWSRRYLFVGVGDKSEAHETHVTIICVTLRPDMRFKIYADDAKEGKSYQAAIIAPDVRHRKYFRQAGAAILLYLMPETDEAYQIRNKYLHSSPIVEISQNVIEALLPQLSAYHLDKYRELHDLNEKQSEALCKGLDCEQGEAICEKIISALGITPSAKLSEELDPHIKEAIRVMDEKVGQKIKASELKVEEIVGEVERRLGEKQKSLIPDFIDEVGVKMSHYKAGLRLREGFKEMKPGVKIRQIAKKLGSDGPAFTKSFKQWFGITPTEISDHSYFKSCPK